MTEQVTVCYLHPSDDLAVSFHHSFLNMALYDMGGPRNIIKPLPGVCSTGGIAKGRNVLTRKALDQTECDWVFWVDADMGFEPDTIERLLMVADKDERPVVGGLCFGQTIETTDRAATPRLSMFPTIYNWSPEHAVFERMSDYPRDTLVRCAGTGAAALLVHRSVFEKIAAEEGDAWFSHQLHPTGPGGPYGHFGEDMSFCMRLMAHEIPLNVHTGVKTSHLKPRWLNEETFDQELASSPTFAVIPTQGKNGHIKDLVLELERQAQCSGIIVLDNGCSTKTAGWLDTHNPQMVQRIEMPDAGIHEMWNRGINESRQHHTRSNIAILNDDLTVGPSFLGGLAAALRSDWNVGVVGANYDGRSGTGLEYVADICANRYDGTGGLPGFAFMVRGESIYRFPEDCKWWYGDNDLVLTHLNHRNVVAIALDTTVEHIDGGGKTGDWVAPEMQPQLAKDKEAFDKKWAPNA